MAGDQSRYGEALWNGETFYTDYKYADFLGQSGFKFGDGIVDRKIDELRHTTWIVLALDLDFGRASGVPGAGEVARHGGDQGSNLSFIQAECKLKRADKAWQLFRSYCPVLRGMDPELYQCEPYVTPGNVDGPDSPLFGRGGWTWYTGSSAWLYRVVTEWILGVRPSWDGLVIDPCIPTHWNGFRMRRTYRNQECRIEVTRITPGGNNVHKIMVDDQPIASNVIRPDLKSGGTPCRQVKVVLK